MIHNCSSDGQKNLEIEQMVVSMIFLKRSRERVRNSAWREEERIGEGDGGPVGTLSYCCHVLTRVVSLLNQSTVCVWVCQLGKCACMCVCVGMDLGGGRRGVQWHTIRNAFGTRVPSVWGKVFQTQTVTPFSFFFFRRRIGGPFFSPFKFSFILSWAGAGWLSRSCLLNSPEGLHIFYLSLTRRILGSGKLFLHSNHLRLFYYFLNEYVIPFTKLFNVLHIKFKTIILVFYSVKKSICINELYFYYWKSCKLFSLVTEWGRTPRSFHNPG